MWILPLAATTVLGKGTGDAYAKDWSQREHGREYISIGLTGSQQAVHAPTGATTCLHALCVLLDVRSHILCREATDGLAGRTNLTEEIRSQTF